MTDPRGAMWRKPFSGVPCKYPGCDEIVNSHLWGCREHWMLIPVELRDKYTDCTRKRDRDRVAKSIEVHLEIAI